MAADGRGSYEEIDSERQEAEREARKGMAEKMKSGGVCVNLNRLSRV